MEQMRKLPIGIQTFEKLREENYLYVDKTALIYQLVSTSMPCFLSRPRRFGKSLLLSTFEAYFRGRKDLFAGLAIQQLENKWEQYPVFHLDLNAEKYDNTDSTISIFNPFSLLNVFQKQKFGNFWFQTGTPTYLVDLLKQSDYDLRLLVNGVEVTASAFSEYRAEANNPLPMIYQSGYLTIKTYDKEVCLYTLRFPNDEVRYGFLNFLVPFYTDVTDDETGARWKNLGENRCEL